MVWLISGNINTYDYESSFNKNGFIDWRQEGKYNIGDIVYIYMVIPIKRIMYKCEVINSDMGIGEFIDDKEFWKDIDKYNEHKNEKRVRLNLLCKVNDNRLSYEFLKNTWVKSWQSPKKIVSKEFNDYIDLCINKKEIDILDAIKQFKKEMLNNKKDKYNKAEELRKTFVSEYPIEKIMNIKLENYMFTKKEQVINRPFATEFLKSCVILNVYYPDKFFPVCVKNTLRGYCTVVGLSFDNNDKLLYLLNKNRELLDWKNTNELFEQWNNVLFMNFCDWLFDEGYKLTFEGQQKNRNKRIEIIEKDLNNKLKGEERDAVVKIRVNQDKFRKMLLNRYSKCCLCNVQNKDFLIASHIKPWSVSTEEEKLDVNNGLLLCPNHDSLFDKGWITFDENGKIIISKNMDEVDAKFMNAQNNMYITLTKENKQYIDYHRKNVFDKKFQ